MLTDRDERALLAATENRITRPLRIRAALSSVGRTLARRTPARPALTRRTPGEPHGRPQDRAQERESVACHPTHTPIRP